MNQLTLVHKKNQIRNIMMIHRLNTHWQTLLDNSHITQSERTDALFKHLIEAYSQPQRHYHNLQHLYACLQHIEEHNISLDKPQTIRWAFWFHDAIYDATRQDNERQSADWAVRELQALAQPKQLIEMVESLIMDTLHHDVPLSGERAWMVDIDTAILGASAAVYQAYSQAIRMEYAHYSEQDYRTGRIQVLQSFLNRQRLYHTDTFYNEREAQARDNLSTEIQRLHND